MLSKYRDESSRCKSPDEISVNSLIMGDSDDDDIFNSGNDIKRVDSKNDKDDHYNLRQRSHCVITKTISNDSDSAFDDDIPFNQFGALCDHQNILERTFSDERSQDCVQKMSSIIQSFVECLGYNISILKSSTSTGSTLSLYELTQIERFGK